MAHRILIVDDAAFMRMMIKDILVKNGFDVVAEASDGAQAVEKFKEHSPDMMIFACGSICLISFKAVIPSISGIVISIVTRSGECSLNFSTACAPSEASATSENHHVFGYGPAVNGY